MRSRNACIGLLVMAILAVAETGRAADASRSLGLGAFLGYSEAEDAEDGTFHIGGDLSLRFLEFLGARLEVAYREDELDTRELGSAVRDASVEYIPILLSGQIYPLGETPISPFAIGGVGFYLTRFELDVEVGGEERTFEDEDSELGYHAGGGVDFNIGPHLTLTGDVRWVFLDTALREIRESDADGIWVTGGVKIFFN